MIEIPTGEGDIPFSAPIVVLYPVAVTLVCTEERPFYLFCLKNTHHVFLFVLREIEGSVLTYLGL